MNSDRDVVAGFGDEWSRFDQKALTHSELEAVFQTYFGIFPWSSLAADSVGFDLGCGSGRWARLVAPRVGYLHCIDASEEALDVARRSMAGQANCEFHLASVDAIPLPDASQDFGYALGVLHHVPDTQAAMASCAKKLKPGAPFLVYCYYRFDNRPRWYQRVWATSNVIRVLVSRMPLAIRYPCSQVLAALVYWPLTRVALIAERLGIDVTNFPLSFYKDRSWYFIRTDALDRFGTRLEQRFTRAEIETMMQRAGLENIRFSAGVPFWCAVGFRASS